jgi:hypothetical protein
MKQLLPIRLSGFILLVLFSLTFYSCSNEIDCHCTITRDEELLLECYNQGDFTNFRNDTTGVVDEMRVKTKGRNRSSCSSPCENGASSVSVSIESSYIADCRMSISHGSTLKVMFAQDFYKFEPKGQLVAVTINNIVYNDVFVCSIDPYLIAPGEQSKVPWKIEHSLSKGLIRMYMVNGQTWSRLN